MRFFLAFFILLSTLFSCQKEGVPKIDISNIDVDVSIERYDVDFYNASKETLLNVKQKYPYLFPKEFTDSLAISKINDKDEQELFTETQKLYKDISPLKKQLTTLFKHLKHYNAKFKPPSVITMLTNISYEDRVIYQDSLLLISLDVYLGKDHKFYADYPKYIRETNTKEHIVVDVANAFINKQIYETSTRTFIYKILYEGKKLYLLDTYLPNVADRVKIGYTKDKLDWAKNNEEQIWKYFIEHKMLYSTETNLNKRFIETAPFSKFYLEQDNLSPGKIGSWIGWQIVRSYMKHNDVSLQKLIHLDSESLLNNSKYKPKK